MTWGNRWTPEFLEELRKRGTVREHKISQPGESLPPIPILGKRGRPRRHRKVSDGVRELYEQIKVEGLPAPELEVRFDAVRKWRFDMAWNDRRIGLEVEGGVYTAGRHVRGQGYEADAIKYNQAQLQGWKVLRYSTGQVSKGIAIADLRKVFG